MTKEIDKVEKSVTSKSNIEKEIKRLGIKSSTLLNKMGKQQARNTNKSKKEKIAEMKGVKKQFNANAQTET